MVAAGRFRRLVQTLLDFLYPATCLVCDGEVVGEGPWVCTACWERLPRFSDGAERASDGLAYKAVWEFDEAVQRIVHAFKFFGKRSLALPLAQRMAAAVAVDGAFRGGDLLVPVPLHKTRLRERGFNQSWLLAQGVSAILGIPCVDALVRQRYTKAQSRLNLAARQQNVAGAFAVRDAEAVSGKHVLLVDDVTTTGATLRACAEVVRQAGAASVRGLTAAKTPL